MASEIPLCLPADSHSRSARSEARTVGSSLRRAETSPDRHPEARCVDSADLQPFAGDRATRPLVSEPSSGKASPPSSPLTRKLHLRSNSAFHSSISHSRNRPKCLTWFRWSTSPEFTLRILQFRTPESAKMARMISMDHYTRMISMDHYRRLVEEPGQNAALNFAGLLQPA
jgi:hypothetical protein